MHRVNAIVMRHMYLFPRSFDRLTDSIFWPILDVVLWGFTTVWISEGNVLSREFVASVLTAIVFWRLVWQANYEVGMNLLEECWNRNLTNIFSSPLTKWEWITATLVVGVVKLVLTLVVAAAAVAALYSFNIFSLGWWWVPFCGVLVVFGWSVGFLASSLILLFGIRAQALAWTFCFLLAPISAVYFPVSVLPGWLAAIAWALPSTYIFEGTRDLILHGGGQAARDLSVAFVLVAVYLASSLLIFNAAFERTRKLGFDHLE